MIRKQIPALRATQGASSKPNIWLCRTAEMCERSRGNFSQAYSPHKGFENGTLRMPLHVCGCKNINICIYIHKYIFIYIYIYMYIAKYIYIYIKQALLVRQYTLIVVQPSYICSRKKRALPLLLPCTVVGLLGSRCHSWIGCREH